ncbi:hypothetical protein EV421DRAFT_1432931 [Armillaria borealis]|uniref:Uncharacterized protein n=1 Tax=Armillaria borealis TaxID=47425 RepID=A0AA39IZR0_9AGAR|nr:hypothetical protein EV421DRAFT_1432931 [Armillaria borealis]
MKDPFLVTFIYFTPAITAMLKERKAVRQLSKMSVTRNGITVASFQKLKKPLARNKCGSGVKAMVPALDCSP